MTVTEGITVTVTENHPDLRRPRQPDVGRHYDIRLFVGEYAEDGLERDQHLL